MRRTLIIIVILVALIVVAALVVSFGKPHYDNWQMIREDNNRMAAREAKQQKMFERMDAAQKEVEQILAADTYGGSTPEETLEMYIDALRAGDAELAAKYYLPWEYEQAFEYHKEWFGKYSSGLQKYLDAYDKHIFTTEDLAVDYLYELTIHRAEDDEYGYGADFKLNDINKIWKLTDNDFIKSADKDKY